MGLLFDTCHLFGFGGDFAIIYGERDRANQKAQVKGPEDRNYAAQRPDGRPPESQLHPSIKEVA